MEQKKLLLIAISVGVFFVIVIGAAILVFPVNAVSAKSAEVPAPVSNRPVSSGTSLTPAGQAEPPAAPAPQEYIREGVQGIQNAPEGSVPADNSFYINGSGSSSRAPAEAAPQTTIKVDPKSAVGVPDAAPAGRAAPVAAAQRTTTPASAVPAVPAPAAPPSRSTAAAPAASQTRSTAASQARSTATAPAASTRSTPSAAASTRPAVQIKTRDDYWVQTHSFTALARAEAVKQTLADKGITSIIENRDIDGTTRFRVRVGPYTSQNEADYWLSLIKSINGFENSQVWKTQTSL
jgi:DedD protein